MSEMVEQEHLLEGLTRTTLGRLILAGEIRSGQGVRTREPWRVYGSYAVVVVTRGRGRYRDNQGRSIALGPGALIFVFPDLPHRYGPPAGQSWDELYLTFDGPVFDLWRRTGLLAPALPVCHWGEKGVEWAGRLQALVHACSPQASELERLGTLHRFLELLAEPLLAHQCAVVPTTEEWLVRACVRLDTQLEEPLSLSGLAQDVGLSYETFRKRFQQAKGVSPARYRMQRRVAMAQQLLRFAPDKTNQQIAESLGFSDAFHFSRRFTEVTGQTPKAFREEITKPPPRSDRDGG